MMAPVSVVQGTRPIVLAFPHTGLDLLPGMAARLSAVGRTLKDTDWWVDRLYADLLPGASLVRAPLHRTAIDVNRDPSGASLYPGQATTDLVPLTSFDGEPLWQEGQAPTAAQTADLLADWHAPYHQALTAELDRVQAAHGRVLLYDCHSIRSLVPRLFEGRLPDLNIGTDHGVSCAAALEARAVAVCASAPGYTHVLNGRFRGGWTVRHHADPAQGRHAIQMELAQSAYLDAEHPPFPYHPAKAERLRSVLGPLLVALEQALLSLP